MNWIVDAVYWVAMPVAQYYLVLMAFYWYHRFVHLPVAGPLYRAHHIGHHKVCRDVGYQ